MRSFLLCGGILLLALNAGAAPRRPPASPAIPGWQRVLTAPAAKADRLPPGWKVVPLPKGFRKEGGGSGAGGVGGPLPETVDEFVRESAIVVVGVGAGNDGGFYPPPQTSLQYTTYYLRVLGYLKDKTGRRAPFLKILAPGGFLDGGQKAPNAPLPYLEEGRRYLLYLKPNRGLDWGDLGRTSSPIGRGDEYWASADGGGLWWEEEGRLVGFVDPPTHWGLPFKVGVLPWPDYLPFGEAVQRAAQAVERERRGVPLVPRPYEPPQFLDD